MDRPQQYDCLTKWRNFTTELVVRDAADMFPELAKPKSQSRLNRELEDVSQRNQNSK